MGMVQMGLGSRRAVSTTGVGLGLPWHLTEDVCPQGSAEGQVVVQLGRSAGTRAQGCCVQRVEVLMDGCRPLISRLLSVSCSEHPQGPGPAAQKLSPCSGQRPRVGAWRRLRHGDEECVGGRGTDEGLGRSVGRRCVPLKS